MKINVNKLYPILILSLASHIAIAMDTSAQEKICRDIGFKPKTEKFASCVIELVSRNQNAERAQAVQQQSIQNEQAIAEQLRIQNEREAERMRIEQEREAKAAERRKNQALINFGLSLMGGAAQPSRNNRTTCHLQGSYVSGMYKTCNYRCPGGVVPRSIGAADICDLTIAN